MIKVYCVLVQLIEPVYRFSLLSLFIVMLVLLYVLADFPTTIFNPIVVELSVSLYF